ncbi:MAG TPA: hypothetical protein VF746_13975 [Longimicrobium sp.]|jgi:hypothetical protein
MRTTLTLAAALLLAAAPAAAQEHGGHTGGCGGMQGEGGSMSHADHAAHAGHAAHAQGGHQHAGGAADSAFAGVQARGKIVMGVDQYTSTHCFDALPDGGRIELQRDADDPEGVATIRRHLREIAGAFSRGDFSAPAAVHMREVPGAASMAARRGVITYTYRDLPRGGEVRIRTADPEALRAVHEFLAFQRGDHRAGGREH